MILISYGPDSVLGNNPWKNKILLGIDRLQYMWYFRYNPDNEMSSVPYSIKVLWLIKIHWSKEKLSSSKWYAWSICFVEKFHRRENRYEYVLHSFTYPTVTCEHHFQMSDLPVYSKDTMISYLFPPKISSTCFLTLWDWQWEETAWNVIVGRAKHSLNANPDEINCHKWRICFFVVSQHLWQMVLTCQHLRQLFYL